MPVFILESTFKVIEDHVLSAYPEEGCGLLIGEVPSDFGEPDCDIRVSENRPLENAWGNEQRNRRYNIDPNAFAKAMKEFLGKSNGIVGIYHSHPDAPARPSAFDLERAWPCYAYVILSVKEGKVAQATAWRLDTDEHRFQEHKLKKVKESCLAKVGSRQT